MSVLKTITLSIIVLLLEQLVVSKILFTIDLYLIGHIACFSIFKIFYKIILDLLKVNFIILYAR